MWGNFLGVFESKCKYTNTIDMLDMRNIETMSKKLNVNRFICFSNSAQMNIGVEWRKYDQHDYVDGRDDKGSVLINQESLHVYVGIYRIRGMIGKIISIT